MNYGLNIEVAVYERVECFFLINYKYIKSCFVIF